jgi:hypothetical protein
MSLHIGGLAIDEVKRSTPRLVLCDVHGSMVLDVAPGEPCPWCVAASEWRQPRRTMRQQYWVAGSLWEQITAASLLEGAAIREHCRAIADVHLAIDGAIAQLERL